MTNFKSMREKGCNGCVHNYIGFMLHVIKIYQHFVILVLKYDSIDLDLDFWCFNATFSNISKSKSILNPEEACLILITQKCTNLCCSAFLVNFVILKFGNLAIVNACSLNKNQMSH